MSESVKIAEINEKAMMENESIENEEFEMLAGYLDKEGKTHKTFELEEITGADEEAIAKKDISSNAGKIVRVLLERCCTRIGTFYKKDMRADAWKSIIQNLLVADQDYMSIKLREISMSETMDVAYKCPACEADLKVQIKIEDLEIKEFNGNRIMSFELPRGFKDKDGNRLKKGTITYPNGYDREVLSPIVQRNVGQANTMMLVRCIKDLEGRTVTDLMMKQLSFKDRTYLFKLMAENEFGLKEEIDVDCHECGHSFVAPLNTVNFI